MEPTKGILALRLYAGNGPSAFAIKDPQEIRSIAGEVLIVKAEGQLHNDFCNALSCRTLLLPATDRETADQTEQLFTPRGP